MADAQTLPLPDFELVTSSATVIVDEIRKLPNVQVFNSADTLAGITNILAELRGSIQGLNQTVNGLRTDINTVRTEVNTVRTDVNSLRTDVNTLRTDVNTQIGTIRTDINNLRADMNSGFNMSDTNSRARVHNSTISDRTLVIHKIATSYGANGLDFPDNFPETAQALSAMSVADLDNLLTAYGLPLLGTLHDKKLHFADFVGLELFL